MDKEKEIQETIETLEYCLYGACTYNIGDIQDELKLAVKALKNYRKADEVRKETIEKVLSIIKSVGINYEAKTMRDYDIYQNALCDVFNKVKQYGVEVKK